MASVPAFQAGNVSSILIIRSKSSNGSGLLRTEWFSNCLLNNVRGSNPPRSLPIFSLKWSQGLLGVAAGLSPRNREI